VSIRRCVLWKWAWRRRTIGVFRFVSRCCCGHVDRLTDYATEGLDISCFLRARNLQFSGKERHCLLQTIQSIFLCFSKNVSRSYRGKAVAGHVKQKIIFSLGDEGKFISSLKSSIDEKILQHQCYLFDPYLFWRKKTFLKKILFHPFDGITRNCQSLPGLLGDMYQDYGSTRHQ